MKIVHRGEVEKKQVDMQGAEKLWKQVPVGAQDGSPLFCFRIFTLEPGGHTPYHAHPFEHLNYVIDGQGVLVAAGGEERPLRQGDCALVLPDEKHQYRNASETAPFVMICAVPKEYE